MTAALGALVALCATGASVVPLHRVAAHYGIVDRPGPRKSHARPVPILGGVAVALGLSTAVLILHRDLVPTLALTLVLVLVGIFDDVFSVRPVTKLVTQGAVAVAATALGWTWAITDSPPLNAGITVIWIVGLSNAFNLLDNMDALCSTAAIVGLLGLAAIAPGAAALPLALAGALAAFLVVNFPPARMFMGDAGSLAVGFVVALCCVGAAGTAHGVHSLVLLVFPVALAVFDTSLVIVSRLRTGRPIQLGGRDHFSHRLRILGWSDRQIVISVAVAAAAGDLIALLAGSYPLAEAWIAVPLVLTYGAVWLRLLRVDPYIAAVKPLEVQSA